MRSKVQLDGLWQKGIKGQHIEYREKLVVVALLGLCVIAIVFMVNNIIVIIVIILYIFLSPFLFMWILNKY